MFYKIDAMPPMDDLFGGGKPKKDKDTFLGWLCRKIIRGLKRFV